MKQTLTTWTIFLALAATTAQGQAEEITAEKKAAAIAGPVTPTASVSIRNCVEKLPEAVDNEFFEVRTIFGVNLLKDSYVLTLESRYTNPHDSAKVTNSLNLFTATPKAYKLGPWALGGYFQEVMFAQQPTIDVVALNIDLAKEVNTAIGTLKGEAYLEGDYMVSGQPSKATYKTGGPKDTGLHLAQATHDDKTGKWLGEKHKPDLYTEFDQIGTFTPGGLTALSFMISNYIRSNYNEVVTVDEYGSQISSNYAQTNDVETVFTVACKLNERLILASDTGVRRDGYYASRSRAKNMENYYTLMRLDATLL